MSAVKTGSNPESIMVALLSLALGLSLFSMLVLERDRIRHFTAKLQVERDIGTLHQVLAKAQSTAQKKHQTIGVTVSPQGWVLFADHVAPLGQQDQGDEIIQAERWGDRSNFGTQLPDKHMYFDVSGTCRITPTVSCEGDLPGVLSAQSM